jgi:hypothetical protein
LAGDASRDEARLGGGTLLYQRRQTTPARHVASGHGCKVLVRWTDKAAIEDANLSDFEIAEAVVAG